MVKLVLGKPHGGSAGGPGNDMPPPGEGNSNLSRRIKVLEERFTNLRSRFQLTEQNMIHKNKNFFSEIKTINVELTDVKREINELKDNMLNLLKELEAFAKREDVDMLRKYIDLWNPVNFVTKNDVDDIVNDAIERRNAKQ